MTTRLYALGSNSSGQLGIGHCEDVDVPTPCQFILASSPTVSATHPGTGSGNRLTTSCDLNSNVRKIVAGGNHTIVLCDNGAVYAAGNGEALGEAVDLGSQYAGINESGFQDLAPYFKRVMWWEGAQLLDTFLDVSATWSASFFVAGPQIQDGCVVRNGQIYVCGRGEKGELGLGTNIVETKRPTQVAVFGFLYNPGSTSNEDGEVFVMPGMLSGIWSSMAHTVTSTLEGHVHGWGSCRKGQLGNGLKEDKVLWTPRNIAHEDIQHGLQTHQILTAAVGRDFTLLQLTHEKQATLMWDFELLGGNRYLGTKEDNIRALLAETSRIISTGERACPKTTPFASWSNIYLLDRHTQRVKGLGRNDRDQLPPTGLPQLRALAAGSEHCVGLTSEGEALVWGWGEHGNCGRKDDESGQGWSVLNVTFSGAGGITGVGAGCATTFIWSSKK